MKRMAKGLMLLVFLLVATVAVAKKKPHPFDKFDHEMHMGFFEGTLPCETCHPTDDAYGDREKMNRVGCHKCHNSPEPVIPATEDCKLCHAAGFPKPESHKASWIAKHPSYAKTNPDYCQQCHSNAMFCSDCHKRRDNVQEKMHRRNFKYFHSVEARANPRKCDSCHVLNFCQNCHAGRSE